VHIGAAAAIQDKRQAVLNAACAANPRRFTRRPRAPKMPGPAWINKPATNSDITQLSYDIEDSSTRVADLRRGICIVNPWPA
jgi:hypothetical protein